MAKWIKSISKKKFFEAFDMWYKAEINLAKAAKHVGVSVPTLTKYFNMYLRGENFPDTLFKDD